MYTFLHRHCAQCAKNQYHTANISIERHVEAASCCYDGHQNGRGLYGCLPSNAGRSCNSLRQLRQARICRRISWVCGGFVLPYKGTKKAREMQIKMLLFSFPSAQVARRMSSACAWAPTERKKVRHFYDIHKKCHDKFPLIFWTYLDLSGHIWTKVDNGSGNCRTFASSIRNDTQTGQDLLLGEGENATQRSSRKLTPTPFRGGESETKNSN